MDILGQFILIYGRTLIHTDSWVRCDIHTGSWVRCESVQILTYVKSSCLSSECKHVGVETGSSWLQMNAWPVSMVASELVPATSRCLLKSILLHTHTFFLSLSLSLSLWVPKFLCFLCLSHLVSLAAWMSQCLSSFLAVLWHKYHIEGTILLVHGFIKPYSTYDVYSEEKIPDYTVYPAASLLMRCSPGFCGRHQPFLQRSV